MAKNQHILRSFQHAFTGIKYTLVHEKNCRIHMLATILVILLSAWLNLSLIEWAVICVVIGMVWAAELFNTALEAFFDLIHPEKNNLVEAGKDSAAGAVLICAVVSVIVGLLILGPPLFHKLFG